MRLDIDPNVCGFTPPQRQRRIADADYEGVPARPGLGKDFDVLTAAESEFQQPTIERREVLGSRAHADNHPLGSG